MQEGSKLDAEVVAILSRDRLNGFATHGGPNSEPVLLGRYLYNMAVSQALYPFLHTLEVVLRNRIHAAVDADRPIDVDQPHLYNDFPCWLDATSCPLTADHQGTVVIAKRDVMKDIRRRHGGTAGASRTYRTPGRLVAKLSFAFWVFLFDSEYVAHGRGDDGILWPRYFEDVFPHRRGQGSIGSVRKMLRRLLVVRNRTMHYERITPWTDQGATLDPVRVRDDILQLITWMASRAADALQNYGVWPTVFTPSYARMLCVVARKL